MANWDTTNMKLNRKDNYNDSIFDCIIYVDKYKLQMRYEMAVKNLELYKNSEEEAVKYWYRIAQIEERYMNWFYPEYII